MVTNLTKSKAVIFTRKKNPIKTPITLDSETFYTSETMKSWVYWVFDFGQSWSPHIEDVMCKGKKFNSGPKFIKIITAQVFSILYYCDIVWLSPQLGYQNFKKLRRCHYAALRIIQGDWRRTMSRIHLNRLTQRLPPEAWCKFSSCSFVIKLSRSMMPSQLWESFSANLYHNMRHQNPTVRDLSLRKVGKKVVFNWIGVELKKLNLKWFNVPNLSDSVIRTSLKKLFYSEYF